MSDSLSPSIILGRLRSNWKSGLTVSLISIPLSISLAIASQTTPLAGIITAVWAGLIGALFGGSRYNIIGPTGALSGTLALYALAHGADTLSAIAIVAGLMVLAAYLLRLERFLIFVPASTIQGFTIGVAFTIAFNQLSYALGLTGLHKHEYLLENIWESLTHISSASMSAVAVFLFFTVALFATMKFIRQVPPVIAWAPVGIILGYLSFVHLIPLKLITLGDQFGSISLSLYQIPRLYFDPSLLMAGLSVALIAILETMISAKIADGMTKTKHNPRKELIGLGFANIVSGVMGGIPATAALARTAANIKSGATHNMSGVVSAACIAVISLFFLSYFRFMPMPVIAAILVFVAARMIDLRELRTLVRHDHTNLALLVLVAFVTIYWDPIIGILVGTTIALMIFVEKLSHGRFEIIANDRKKGIVASIYGEKVVSMPDRADTLVYSMKSSLVYINGAAHVARFTRTLINYENVILRLRELDFIDLDGVDALDEIIETIAEQGKKVALCSIPPHILKALEEDSETYRDLKKKKLVFAKTEDALRFFGHKLVKSGR